MSTPETIIVIGGGMGGAHAVKALRNEGYEGTLRLFSAEEEYPYERPPMSKEYLAGDAEFDEALALPKDWYSENNIDLHLSTRVTKVDAEAKEITTADGKTYGYDKLILATGSSARMIPLPGIEADGVFTLRDKKDADTLKTRFGKGKKLVTIGGGWVGLEVAASARQAGTDVTVLEAGPMPLVNILGPKVAQVYSDVHKEHGVDIRTGAKVAKIIENDGVAQGVQLEDGTTFDADTVVVGVGGVPNLELAESAGLDIDNGVLVDSKLRTSNPDIFAVGDIANHDHPFFGKRLRVEHWNIARTQPKAVAKTIMGAETDYTEQPYFYSDQYDLGMEYVGHAGKGTYDKVVIRGDLDKREFIAFWLSDNRIVAEMNVNIWDIPDVVTPLIDERKVIDPAKLEDESVDLSSL